MSAGTVYTVTLYDEYANVVPIENIASHYGHDITAMGYDGASGHSSSSGERKVLFKVVFRFSIKNTRKLAFIFCGMYMNHVIIHHLVGP